MAGNKLIALIPYRILPAKLGGEKGIALFYKYLGKKKEVIAIGTANNSVELAENYDFRPELSNSRLRYLNIFLYFKFRKLIKENNASAFVIEHPYYGWLAYFIRKTTRVKWVVHSHNIEFLRSKSIGRSWWKILAWYETWVYKKADLNFFISDDNLKFAINEMKVPASKSATITYGIEETAIPGDRAEAAQRIRAQYAIRDDEKILLFNGALYHHQNYDAVTAITEHINPILLKTIPGKYRILICGKGLPDFFNDLKDYKDKNITYAGFVDDISIYFKAADIFLNPILTGGGIKTKAVEAISMNCTVVSTYSAAIGIKPEVCGSKINIIKDGDWQSFANKVVECFEDYSDTPAEFFRYYYWGAITGKAADLIDGRQSPSI